MKPEDIMLWIVFWFLIFCSLFTSNLGLLFMEIILMVGIAIVYKYFKQKERLERDKND